MQIIIRPIPIINNNNSDTFGLFSFQLRLGNFARRTIHNGIDD